MSVCFRKIEIHLIHKLKKLIHQKSEFVHYVLAKIHNWEQSGARHGQIIAPTPIPSPPVSNYQFPVIKFAHI
jgi:hypothetical protein